MKCESRKGKVAPIRVEIQFIILIKNIPRNKIIHLFNLILEEKIVTRINVYIYGYLIEILLITLSPISAKNNRRKL